MSANLLGDFCCRILQAYRQHFPVKHGGAWVEGDTIFFSFNHPQCTLLLSLIPSNPELETRLTVNLSSADNVPSVSVDSTGIRWNSSEPGFFTTEELQSFENLASRLYLIALDSSYELQLLTSITVD